MRGSCTNSNCSFNHNPKLKGSNGKRKSESDDSPKKKRTKPNNAEKNFLDKSGLEDMVRGIMGKQENAPPQQQAPRQQFQPTPHLPQVVWPQAGQQQYGGQLQQPQWMPQPVMMAPGQGQPPTFTNGATALPINYGYAGLPLSFPHQN